MWPYRQEDGGAVGHAFAAGGLVGWQSTDGFRKAGKPGVRHACSRRGHTLSIKGPGCSPARYAQLGIEQWHRHGYGGSGEQDRGWC